MSALTVGSLFSGVGGLDLGLERAGMRVVWQIEKDPFAQQVLRKHWPRVELFSDVCTVGGGQLKSVDVICGGFPCTDVSNAGKRAGITGNQSGLWKQFHRIIDEVAPSWVVIENVAALRSRGLDVVLGDLAASGFDASWDCLPASAFSAPHRRDRIFIVAYSQREALRIESRWGRGSGRSSPLLAGLFGKAWPPPGPRPWSFEPLVCGADDGAPGRLDRLRAIGNSVVPHVAEHVGRMIVEAAQ